MSHICLCNLLIFLTFFFFNTRCLFAQTNFFDYKRYLFGSPPTITLSVQSLDTSTGSVTINGVDTQGPTTPFTWNWGDGSMTSGFFPQSHTYTTTTKNYIAKVTANYSGGTKDSADVLLRFVPLSINPIALSPDIAVTIPNNTVDLISRQPGYGFSSSLSYFDDSFFSTIPRSTIEYILSVIAAIEKDMANDDVFLINDKFQQVMLRDSSFGGAYSIWYSSPIAFGAGDSFLKGTIGFSSLFHEMGHNMTLNSPAKYIYGGKIDGDANAIFSESMAQIFQHTAGFHIINNYLSYGLSNDLVMFDIKNSVVSSISIVRSSYERYLKNGKEFASWNDSSTSVDETFDTFMTIAYKFFEQAENTGGGYTTSLKRMMRLLQAFDSSWQQRYDPLNNTAAADTFRATLMATAVSYAFAKDLRSDFRDLNFPISDQIYDELYDSATSGINESGVVPRRFELSRNYPNPFNPSTTIGYALPTVVHVALAIYNVLGEQIQILVDENKEAGYYQVQWKPQISSGTYFYRLQAGTFVKTNKLILLK
jgi:hypothetical protein